MHNSKSTVTSVNHPLDATLSAATTTRSVSAWEHVPLFASKIVGLYRPSGLPPQMIELSLTLVSRILHGEDSERIKRRVDDFWDEVPEILDQVVGMFDAHSVPLLIADSAIEVARQVLRGEGADSVLPS
ncbi:hypothetical protein [Sorangium sp. So ce1151]|uniref:hypothetical protein n=1 Tax=Sorangium sp. So ce1151 TaxID=3133332 RepID=UPI003F63D789